MKKTPRKPIKSYTPDEGSRYHIQHRNGTEEYCQIRDLSPLIMVGDDIFVKNSDGSEDLIGIITPNTYARLLTDFAEYAIVNLSRKWDQRTIDTIAVIRKRLTGETMTQEELKKAAKQSSFASNRFHSVDERGEYCDYIPDYVVADVIYSLVSNQQLLTPLNQTAFRGDGLQNMEEEERQGLYIISYLSSAEYIFSLGLS